MWTRLKTFVSEMTADKPNPRVEAAINRVLAAPVSDPVRYFVAKEYQRDALEKEMLGDINRQDSLNLYQEALTSHNVAIHRLKDSSFIPLTTEENKLKSISINIIDALNIKIAAARTRNGLFASANVADEADKVVFHADQAAILIPK